MDFAEFVDIMPELEEKFKEEFLHRVAQRTPVRTGALKAGWEWDEQGDSLYFTNDVEYAIFVEQGTSKMAPRMMVGTTLLEVDDILKQVVKEVIG